MATYRITAPDGQQFDVTGRGTEADAMAHIKSTWVDSRTSDYGNEGHNRGPINPDADAGVMTRLAAGVSGKIDTIRSEGNKFVKRLFPDQDPNRKTLITGTAPPVIPKDPEFEAGMQRSHNRADFYQQTKDQLGTAGAVGDIGTEVALSALPIAKGGQMLSKVPVLAKALGRAAPAVADIVANATYEGGKSAVQGNDLGQVLEDTAWGAGGAAVPHAVVGGVKAAARGAANAATSFAQKGITPEARALVNEGIELTPGQMNPKLAGIEENAKRVPFLGSAIEKAQGNARGQYVTKEVNNALAPLEQGVTTTGRKALDEAHDIVSAAYNKFVPDVHIVPGDLRANLVKLDDAVVSDLGLSKKQTDRLYDTVVKKISPALEKAEAEGGSIDGRTFKNIDSKIGDLARKYTKSANPDHHALGEAYYEMQRQLRSSLSPLRLGAEQDIKKANQAFKSLLDVTKAGNREGGIFTPDQLRKVVEKGGGRTSDFNRAAQEVLKKGAKADPATYRTVLGLGGLGYSLYDPQSVIGSAVVGYGAGKLYSQKGIRAIAGRMIPGSQATIMSGRAAKQPSVLMRAAAKSPISKRQAAAQAGRMLASDDDQ